MKRNQMIIGKAAVLSIKWIVFLTSPPCLSWQHWTYQALP
ncbi:hypothetical protein AAULR_21157 [Lacticaseibacillus rhamnosus MTCC 5462]|nr:hypothetical protein AAULR_21157 [Lacticaseibacillus rhamnosus MTCC 5462]